MSKLQAAIRVLGEYVLFAESRRVRESSKAAIRVLEAARRVDKTRCQEWLSFRSYYLNPTLRDQATKKQINALLEALPEKEKK
jgi:hypothetical protein